MHQNVMQRGHLVIRKKWQIKLAQLVIAGIKTATSSNYLLYDENEAIPYPGLHHIILDGNGKAAAIVETTFVEVVPFDQVTEEQAYLEVEGDRTLKYWRMCTKTFLKKNSRQSIKRSILKYL